MSSYVLIVESDEAARAKLAATVEETGLEVRPVINGEQALAIAVARRPALVILNLSLPGMDGFATMSALRADSRTHDLPVVVMASFEDMRINMLSLPGGPPILHRRRNGHLDREALERFLSLCQIPMAMG